MDRSANLMHKFNTMPHKDTTDPSTYRMMVPVFTDPDHASGLKRAEEIHLRLVGFYHSVVGEGWSSGGREESDCFNHIHLVCRGKALIRHQGQDFHLRCGSAYLLTGNTPVIRVAASQYECYVLKFSCESLRGPDLLLDWAERRPLCLGSWDRKRWESRWKGRRFQASSNVYLALRGQIALWLADGIPELDKIIAQFHRKFSRYGRVLDLVESRLGADLRIHELAKTHGTSLHAFSMAFARDTGVSPKTYLNRRLNQEACHLIAGTDRPIKEIATQLRFADEYYFSRFFYKMNGMRPGKYRHAFFRS